MLFVKYKSRSGPHVVNREFADEPAAEATAAALRERGFQDVVVLIDLKTADRNARAMAFTPVPHKLLRRDGYDSWHNRPVVAS